MLTHPRRTLLVLATGAALLLGACSGATPTSQSTAAASQVPAPTSAGAAPSADAGATTSTADGGTACRIVTNDAVGQAAGFAVANASGAAGICMFQNAERSKYLSVTLFGSQAEMALMLQVEPSADHVADLGDDAFWVPSGGLLFVRQGDHAIEVLDPDLSTDGTNTASRDALVALARTALPRL